MALRRPLPARARRSRRLREDGEDLATLFVTTATRGCEREPLAGALFEFRPGVHGLPATPFAG